MGDRKPQIRTDPPALSNRRGTERMEISRQERGSRGAGEILTDFDRPLFSSKFESLEFRVENGQCQEMSGPKAKRWGVSPPNNPLTR